MKDRLIFHVDVNSAFLSWEAVYRLNELNEKNDIRNLPSAIAGDKEKRCGIILAKSMPAKRAGVKTAETIGDARKKCPDLMLFPPRFEIYSFYSEKFFDLLKEFAPVVEKFSIDEAYLDMTGTMGIYGDYLSAAEKIKVAIKERLGFTVNIGISCNRLLAKMASDFEKPDKTHTLFPEEVKTKMWPLPAGELFFVGRTAVDKLNSMGIKTIGDLANTDVKILKSFFKKHGEVMYAYANGIDDSEFGEVRTELKGYGNSTNISADVKDEAVAKKVILGLTETVASRLRKDRVVAKVIAVSIVYYDFSKKSHQMTMDNSINTTNVLYKYACRLFDEMWNGIPIRNIGVSTGKISPDNGETQISLFDDKNLEKNQKMDRAADIIRNRFGNDSIKRGSQL